MAKENATFVNKKNKYIVSKQFVVCSFILKHENMSGKRHLSFLKKIILAIEISCPAGYNKRHSLRKFLNEIEKKKQVQYENEKFQKTSKEKCNTTTGYTCNHQRIKQMNEQKIMLMLMSMA